ncbi:YcxB family protein [Flavobacterium sp.]|uniref:YcxB family protein n=1 Tax=Flavobacterium sp. TaxID=239 RepID=UPI003D112D7D
MEKEIVFTPNFTFKEYFKANLYIYSRRILTRILLFIFSLIVLLNLALFILTNELSFGDFINNCFPFFIFPTIIIVASYILAKRALDNPKIKEEIKIHLNNSFYEEIGETFRIKFSWNEFSKIIETKTAYLLFQSTNNARIIIKENLNNEQLNDLALLFKSLNIKKSLK